LSFADQLGAINRARRWAEQELGVGMGLVVDVLRVVSEDDALMVTDWAIGGMGDGVVALGLAGPEEGNPPERYAAAFARARDAGLPGVPHAGETEGAASVRGALDALGAVRIGHGVRCLEDTDVVAVLRAEQIPLEVCPTSNVCLGVAPSLASHPLPRLLDEGLYVTINSDDPPMFGTTLTREYRVVAETFGFDASVLADFARNAARAALLPAAERKALEARVERELAALAPAAS
jgi:adenosine deaminase